MRFEGGGGIWMKLENDEITYFVEKIKSKSNERKTSLEVELKSNY